MNDDNVDLKIHDSKGKLYQICPFLEKIIFLLGECNLPDEVIFEINRHFESIQEIARHLRGEDIYCGILAAEKIHSPYNFSALIRTIKIAINSGTLTQEKLDEIVELYR